MLKTAILSLPMDTEALVRNVTELVLGAILTGQHGSWDDLQRLQQELDRVQQKKAAMMDAYFSGEITKEDMQAMKERYVRQLSDLRNRLKKAKIQKENKQDPAGLRIKIQSEILAILRGESESEVFYKTLLHSLTVYKDCHMELRLNRLPQVFYFSG
jgi:ElaB/YqjD/DUF883 family membrane-anchored ribosome-binding protein